MYTLIMIFVEGTVVTCLLRKLASLCSFFFSSPVDLDDEWKRKIQCGFFLRKFPSLESYGYLFFFEKIKIYFLRICCTSRHGFEDSCNDLEKGLDERIVCTSDRGKVFRRKFTNSIYLESEILLIHYHWINFNH